MNNRQTNQTKVRAAELGYLLDRLFPELCPVSENEWSLKKKKSFSLNNLFSCEEA